MGAAVDAGCKGAIDALIDPTSVSWEEEAWEGGMQFCLPLGLGEKGIGILLSDPL